MAHFNFVSNLGGSPGIRLQSMFFYILRFQIILDPRWLWFSVSQRRETQESLILLLVYK